MAMATSAPAPPTTNDFRFLNCQKFLKMIPKSIISNKIDRAEDELIWCVETLRAVDDS